MPAFKNNRREYTRVSVEKTKILLGKLDPFIALQAWAKLGFAKMPGEAVFALFQSSAAKDPDGAAALAAGIPDEKMRKVAEDALLAGLALADPAKALAQLPQGSPLRDTIYNHAFATLAATDPQLAISFIEKLPSGEHRWARINFCSAWLKHDPAAAAKYAQENSPPQWRSYFARNLVDAVEAGQAKAPDWQIVSQLQDPVMRIQLGGVTLSRVLEQGPEAFQQQWEILTPQQQAESLAGMAGTTPGNNPLQAHWTELAPKVTALQWEPRWSRPLASVRWEPHGRNRIRYPCSRHWINILTVQPPKKQPQRRCGNGRHRILRGQGLMWNKSRQVPVRMPRAAVWNHADGFRAVEGCSGYLEEPGV